MQKVISTHMNTNFYNIQSNISFTHNFVGKQFTQRDMLKMIAVHKKRRKTFQRRLLKIMNVLNPRIHLKFRNAQFTMFEVFEEQLSILKEIVFKRVSKYFEDEEEKSKESVERKDTYELDPNSFNQKQDLIKMDESSRIKSVMKTYDFRQS